MIKLAAVLLLVVASAMGQQQTPEKLPDATSEAAQKPQTIAANDQILITAKDVEGIGERPFRVELDGTVTLPLVGRIRAAGSTVEQLEKELTTLFAVFVRNPQVSVRRLPAQSTQADTIMVAGAFKNPGVYTLSDRRSLLEVLSYVGGLQPNAARTIKITRRLDASRPPLPLGVPDPAANVSTAVVNVSRLMDNPNGQQILIEPNDILLAGPAGVVFLTGEVLRPGPVELVEKDSFGLTELISMGGGLNREAAPAKTKILRPILNGTRRAEIIVDVKSILAGRQADFPVMPNDMVVVPAAGGKARAVKRAALFVVPGIVTTLIFVALR